jgi:PEP-CTERM motif
MTTIRQRMMVAMAAVTVLATAVTRASAGITLATTASSITPNDSIDWGQLGPDSTSLPNSARVTSANGLAVRITTDDPSGLVRVDEGTSWQGNFTVGDQLINNNQFSFSPLRIAFASPIGGAGAQIQLDADGPFTATIEAFSGTTSLGTFTEHGISTSLEDDSAIFIGVLDTTAGITSIVFGIDNPPSFGGDFAINALSINTFGAVPEPSSLVLAGLAVACGFGLACKRSAVRAARAAFGQLDQLRGEADR